MTARTLTKWNIRHFIRIGRLTWRKSGELRSRDAMAATAQPGPFDAVVDLRGATSAPVRIALADAAPQPWRNGGGVTRELLAWPSAAAWRVRISVADISAPGPFSSFRRAALVRRARRRRRGACRSWPAIAARPGAIRHWSSTVPRRPDAALLGGPTRDLNLMLRGGARGRMERAEHGVAWSAPRALARVLRGGPALAGAPETRRSHCLAHTLLHGSARGPQRLLADGPEPMLWIAADPGDN